jgi:DNA helicase II / ATP-dependent DNA helicase PcrA
MPSLLEDLNPIQQKAVKQTKGPILILAGAGSGKTRVLTYKVAYLIEQKVCEPYEILAITFTNKASQEMKERILKLLDSSGHPVHSTPVMSTFHSFAARVLRRDGGRIGLAPNFTIYDEGDSLDAIKEALAELGLAGNKKINPWAIKKVISEAKNNMISEMEYPNYARGFFQETAAKVYIEYQKILRRNEAVDFDDLLHMLIKLFQNDPETLSRYQQLFKFILVDEYQDTNTAQYQIVKMLASRYRNICVVGDASQSIYAFRGADYRNIVNFKKDYNEAKVFNLEQNYRSTQNILDAATEVISHNKSHPVLKLWTENHKGDKITLYEARSEVDEANFIIDAIRSSGASLNNFAILYRTNAQSRSFEEIFLKSGMPYRLVGGVQFYERKEIKDVLAYLRLVANPKDSVSAKRIDKIGKTRAKKFYEWANSIKPNHVIASEAWQSPSSESEIALSKTPRNDGLNTLEILDEILRVTEYLDYLDDDSEMGLTRIENVKELRSVAEIFPNIVQFLENVALIQDKQMPDGKTPAGEQAEAVTLMTIHAAKGLEFESVFLVGLEEGLFPHSRSMLDPTQMEEERRLAYVGITRAKQKLFLSYARSRLYFGTRSNNLPSRFLANIPESLLDQKLQYQDADKFADKPDWESDHLSTIRDDDDWLNS